MNWIKITKENRHLLKPGNWVKYHDGFEWCERTLSQYNCEAGWILTGNQGETRDLINNRPNDKWHDVFVAEESLLQNQQPATSIKQPDPPRFLFAPDPDANQLYIIHTQQPLAVIWVNPTVPAQLLVMQCELYDPNTDDQQAAMKPDDVQTLSELLRDAADWYRQNAIEKSN